MGIMVRNSTSNNILNSMICNIYEDNETTYITLTNHKDKYETVITRKYNNISDNLQLELSESDVIELLNKLGNLKLTERNKVLTLVPQGLTLITRGSSKGDISISLDINNPSDLETLRKIKTMLNELTVGKCIKVKKSYSIGAITYLIMNNKQNKLEYSKESISEKQEKDEDIIESIIKEVSHFGSD